MRPEYFINNIKNNLLPHYERMALLCFVEKQENQTIKYSDCSNALYNLLSIHANYITENKKGFIWKKVSYSISPEGKTFLQHYRHKYKYTFTTLKQYIQNIGNDIPSHDDIIHEIEIISRRDFKSFADFMIQRDILNGTFKRIFIFKSLNSFNSIYKEYKRMNDVWFDDFSLSLFYILAKEICGDDVDKFFKPIDNDRDEEILPDEPTDSDEHTPETNVKIDFSDD